jgi:hypothetical protein
LSDLRDFVRVTWEFYPQLEAYYNHRIAAWFAQNTPLKNEDEDSD